MPELTWSARPIRSSVAVGSPNIDFMGLFDFSQLQLSIEGLTHATVGADPEVLIKLSFDNVNFDDDPLSYIHIGWTAAPAAPNGGFWVNTALAENISLNGRMVFDNWNAPRTTWINWRGGRAGAAGGLRWFEGYSKQAKPAVGMRITNSLGYNWTTNLGVYLRQRQST